MTPSARTVEVDSLAAFDAHLVGSTSLDGWFVQAVDLTGRGEALRRVHVRGAVFLGCLLTEAQESSLRARGALLFPSLPDLPFDPYRPRLYAAEDLYGAVAGPYARSADAAIYAWSRPAGPTAGLAHTLAAALHDHSIGDALDDASADLDPRQVVGVRGGHALRRGEPDYRAAAELGERLTRGGKTVLTGGGPGAMEAANLGAYLSPWPGALTEALPVLTVADGWASDVDRWLAGAFAVRDRWPAAEAGASFSVPTWFYGHEPTNVFATGIAKYFANALREDTLLHRCRGGIVYLPGQAGTVQEIFQAVTDNFYAVDSAELSPMVLVGRAYWTATYPAWPLLERLARGRSMAGVVSVVDTVAEAADVILT
ncbi:MAG: Rossmann fold nucleotide-binding protein [Propionibacteriaceae bacterium]